MELKFTNAERKSINNGSISNSAASKIENKLPGFVEGRNPYQAAIDWTKNYYTWLLETGSSSARAAKHRYGMDVDAGANPDVESKKPIQDISNGSIDNGNHIRNIDIRLGFGGVVNTLNNFIQASNDYTTYDDFLASTKYDEGNVGGIKYIKESIDDRAKSFNVGKLPKFSKGYVLNGIGAGASAGAVAGPVGAGIGAVVGGLLGGIGESIAGDQEMYDYNKAMEKARLNTLKNRNGAITLLQRILNALKYGLLEQLFFGAKNGKLPGFADGFTLIPKVLHTINGKEIGIPNAKVEPQEYVTLELADGTIIGNRYDDGKVRTKRPGDILYTQTNDALTIWTNNKDPYTGIPFSDEAEARMKAGIPLYDLQQRMAEWQLSKNSKSIAEAKCGKLPGHAEGWLGNFIPSAMGAFAGLNLTLSAYRNNPYRPNTYVSNPYETEALTTLAGLRVNPYPIINLLRSAEARTNRAIDIAGGLSGGLRTAARLANLNTTQNNISNLLSNIQQQNNAYKANYAQAAINAGQASRQARMQANQWDLDMYAKAHAARNRGIQTGIANMLSQIQQYQANEFKRRQFNDTMDLYRADQKLRKEQFDWMRNTLANLPYYSLYNNIYGNPIKDNDVIEFDPYGARAYRKRNGLSIGG